MPSPTMIVGSVCGVIIFALGIYIEVLRNDRAELKTENAALSSANVTLNHSLDVAEQTNAENLAEFAKLTSDYARAKKDYETRHVADQAALASFSKLKGFLGNVKPADDGPLSPVVFQLFDQLCRLQAAAENSRRGGEGGSSEAADRACGQDAGALAARPKVTKQSELAVYVSDLWRAGMGNYLKLRAVNDAVWGDGQ